MAPTITARDPVDVVIPVYGAPEELARCVASVLRFTDLARHRMIVVLDGPQPAATHALVDRLPAGPGVLILQNPARGGFVISVNRGMSLSDRDVILLNSDTRVTTGWVTKLQDAARSAPDIASVTPFSNNGTICSLPRALEANELPAGWDADAFGSLVESRSARSYPRLPTGVGFCLYVARRALDRIGLFDHAKFGEGYGEECDWCMRATQAGFSHILDDATFIYHEGQRSFGASRGWRTRAADRVMRRHHPSYFRRVSAFIARDPLRPLRESVLGALAPTGGAASGDPVVHIVHGWPPWSSAGTEQYAAWLVRRQARTRDVAVYARIADASRANRDVVELLDGGARVRLVVNNFSQIDPLARNALYDRALDADFARFFDDLAPRLVHVHHLAGHAASLVEVAARRGVPIVYQVHDWWAPCARTNLLDAERRPCSGPAPAKCATCRPLVEMPPASLLNRGLFHLRGALMKRALRSCDAFVMGSHAIRESYLRLGYLHPSDRAHVIPYGIDLAAQRAARPPRTPGAPLRFGVIGSIMAHKGIHVAVAAFAQVDPARATLSVWGNPEIDPGYTRELRSAAGPGTTLCGSFADAERAAVLATLDVLLVPSLGLESFGLVAREAMFHDVPVIAADRGALTEMLADGDGGALFDPDDPHALRAWIDRLIADPSIIDAWVARLPTVKSADVHAAEIDAIYAELLAARRGSP